MGLNQFLSLVYGADTRLSTLLCRLGFDEDQIGALRSRHLDRVVDAFIQSPEQRIVDGSGGERLYRICRRRYGLDGDPPETLETIGQALGISRERVRQLQQKAVRRSKARGHKRFWETALQDTAAGLVGPLVGRSAPRPSVLQA